MQAYKIMHGHWGMGQMMFTKYLWTLEHPAVSWFKPPEQTVVNNAKLMKGVRVEETSVVSHKQLELFFLFFRILGRVQPGLIPSSGCFHRVSFYTIEPP